MSRLTPEERRRIFLTQERTRRAMLARMSTASVMVVEPDRAGRRWLQRLVKMAMILTLFTGGLIVSEIVELHPPPTSLIEALLPRL
jgi:hypothetical protein